MVGIIPTKLNSQGKISQYRPNQLTTGNAIPQYIFKIGDTMTIEFLTADQKKQISDLAAIEIKQGTDPESLVYILFYPDDGAGVRCLSKPLPPGSETNGVRFYKLCDLIAIGSN